jgi:hypothetical protein
VVTGMSEAEVKRRLAKIIRRHGGPHDVDPHTLQALARAGMMGTSPEFRKTLRPSFDRAHPAILAEGLRSFERALLRSESDSTIVPILLERALTASRRMGFQPAKRPGDGRPSDHELDPNPSTAPSMPKATRRGSRHRALPVRR